MGSGKGLIGKLPAVPPTSAHVAPPVRSLLQGGSEESKGETKGSGCWGWLAGRRGASGRLQEPAAGGEDLRSEAARPETVMINPANENSGRSFRIGLVAVPQPTRATHRRSPATPYPRHRPPW